MLILHYSLPKKIDKISKPESGHFQKAIQLPNELVVTSDDD